MTDINVLQMPCFKKMYMKLHSLDRAIVNKAIQSIIETPEIGHRKQGDFMDVFICKFNPYEMMIAYKWNKKQILLLAISDRFAYIEECLLKDFFPD